ncbi:Structural maintenance of chromosomes protein 4 [Orchesella cincta]|uniref:Structural maintenance of chromosomes protein 4 n=1 Tax=Orchesella cincta TaxID=48709 RepID=A0A1D2MPT5_ORCCI|nr:Structural maintenance of chromosomes protein 4 [Orchesella cincta]
MPIKRPSGSPLRSRKRPRAKPSTGGINEVGGPAAREEDEEDEDVQADYQEEGGYYVEDIHIPPPMKLTERPTKGERLIIEKIECENFKSYGGVKVMGPFHKSFSAIVGPNGNGKSNIIDAMLFVFGYRAKKIRCKKVSVLIHKSELLPRVSSCAVTVHFVKIIDNGDDDPSDEVNVVPNSKVTVCRRAYQNNSSSYILNGRKVVFAEVAELLKKNGIDIVHNRFLILQGEVEQIAQMPPKATNTHETGFLEFIDEIIGTKRYEKPLEQLKVKMEEIEVTRESKSQRVTLAQQHKQGLVEPMKKATAFLRDRNTKIRTNHVLHQVKAYHYRKQGAEKSEKLKGLEETKSEIQNRLDEINKYNEERRQEYAEAEKAYKVAESNYKKYKKRMDDADEKYVTLNREVKTSNEERKKKMKDIEKLAEELEKLQGLPERHGAEIGKLEKRKVELTSDIQTEEKATKGDMDKLIKQMDQCVAEKQKLDAKFRQLKAVVDEKKALRDTLQKELDRSKSNEETEKNKLIKLQEELQELEKTVKRKSGEGLNLDPDLIRKKEAEATKNRGKAASMENLEQEKRATYMNLRGKFSDAQESMRGGMITDSVDKAMFAAKQGGRFGGLYGRLKDLATIDNKYNIGATAASSMTDYWVVDSDQTAAECITFLKEKRLPSQSFLCLNQMGSYARRSKDPFRTPADSLRIFDLFKITHPELAPVFYRAYSDTLIAENIDIASKVAYGGSQRHRTVTCQGEIIETTG